MSAQHTPGRVCDECEGFCLQPVDPRIDAGIDISFRIGQRVRHQDYQGKRVTGLVMGLTVDSERGLMVDCALDAPIVIPPGDGYGEIKIHRQHAPAHEFSPFDDRDELVAELVAALREALSMVKFFHGPDAWEIYRDHSPEMKRCSAAIAKATGSAS